MDKFIASLGTYLFRSSPKKLIFLCIFIVAFSYINSLGIYFIWDDYHLVVSNQNIRTPELSVLFGCPAPETAGSRIKSPEYYRPLQVLTYALDYRLWRLNPFGYHITNIILHGITCIILYYLFMSLGAGEIIAFLASLLFGINPVFTSTVAYISGRADILAQLFTLLTVVFFIKGLKGNGPPALHYIVSLFCFSCALLSKEIGAISLIFLFIAGALINNSRISKIKPLLYLPYVSILLLYYRLKPIGLPGWVFSLSRVHGILLIVLTLAKGLLLYTLLAIIPFNLRMGRSFIVINSLTDKWVYAAALFLVFLILGIIKMRKNRLFLLGLAWFYVPLFIGLLFDFFFAKRGNEMLMPEHNLYFCYPGLLIALFSLWQSFRPKAGFKKAVVSIAGCMLILYIARSIAYTMSETLRWQDEVKFYETTLKRNKSSLFNFVVYANLGYAYEREDKIQKAEDNFKRAAELSANMPIIYNQLAHFYIRNGYTDKAIDALRVSLGLDDNFSQTYSYLGIAYALKGRSEEAENNFKKALSINPRDETALRYLSLLQER